MSKFSIQFNTDNAAFDNGTDRAEIQYILYKIKTELTEFKFNGIIRDSNGNTIGNWSYSRS